MSTFARFQQWLLVCHLHHPFTVETRTTTMVPAAANAYEEGDSDDSCKCSQRQRRVTNAVRHHPSSSFPFQHNTMQWGGLNFNPSLSFSFDATRALLVTSFRCDTTRRVSPSSFPFQHDSHPHHSTAVSTNHDHNVEQQQWEGGCLVGIL